MLTRVRSCVALLVILVAGAVGFAPPAAAEPLQIDPADKSLVIRGVLTPTTSTFVGNVRLTAPGKDATLRLLSTDLKLESDPTVLIERAKVTLPSVVKLAKDEPQDVRVSVGPVTRPGVYTGTLRFHAEGSPATEEVVVPLRLEVHAPVAVTAIPPAVAIAVARNGWGDAFLPDRLTQDSMVFVLDNPAAETVKVQDIDVYLRGESTARVLGPGEIQWEVVKALSPGKATRITLTFPRSDLSPDLYKGRVRVRLEGSETPVSVPLDLSVRVGPFWPVVAILFGIVMGRIARTLATPGAQMQAELYPRLLTLRRAAAKITDETVRKGVEASLDAVERRIEQAVEPKEAVAKTLDELSVQIDGILIPRTGGPAAGFTVTPTTPPWKIVVWSAAFLAFLTGVRASTLRVRFWLFQPLVFVVLLGALVLLGLQTLYFTSGATFGVNGPYDYFGLFLWGVSSEIAQKSLQQLAPRA